MNHNIKLRVRNSNIFSENEVSKLITESKTKSYCTFVADIKDSRYGDTSRWGDLTALLEFARVKLNEIFADALEKDVVFSGGDSIQGVFYNPQDAYLYGRLLQKLFYPEKITVGIGIGNIFTFFDDKNSNYSTGAAFINAQIALSDAKKNNIDMQVYSDSIKTEEINLFLEMITIIKSNQTDNQKELDLMVEVLFPYISPKISFPSFKIIEIIEHKNGLSTFIVNTQQDSDEMRIDVFLSNLKQEIADYFKTISLPYGKSSYLELLDKINIYGIQSDIALLTNTTKQNISKMFKKARIENIRRYELMVYKMIGDSL
ncbi:MAG TPA: hypothetical protein DDW82_07335 [Acholeplasmataceae bacterium]|nr:hypothetical protein [Acholeplasmataceae bacterium]HCB65975.1 hypothetical protein [Acholeplasmataceae bacterium]